MRDCRVSTIYEGTTQVQALDLLGRKIMLDQGRAMNAMIAEIDAFCEGHQAHARIGAHAQLLRGKLADWQALVGEVGSAAMKDPDEAGSASVDFLLYSGYVLVAWYWLRLVLTAEQKLANGGDVSFCQGKFKAADFYFARLLPRTLALATSIRAGGNSLMAMTDEEF